MAQSKFVRIIIDGNQVEVPTETTILEAAKQADIDIPTICYHPALTANGLCRHCIVEVEGSDKYVASCVTEVNDEMVVQTSTEEIIKMRRTILEMLDANVNLAEAPDLQKQLKEYGADINRFSNTKLRGKSLMDDNPFYVRDYEQCILCWGCVQACGDDLQYTYSLSIGGRGYASYIATYFDKPMPETTCVFCGNCVAVCPTGALKSKNEHMLELGLSHEQIRENKRKK
jgi:NADH dehydrogenase/NADH:ubiquinone oxidoreductase subunit G